MKIKLKGGQVHFSWGPIEGALTYGFSLFEKTRAIEKALFSQSDLKSPHLSVAKERIEKNTLYSWTIKAETLEGKSFEYTGDFILVR